MILYKGKANIDWGNRVVLKSVIPLLLQPAYYLFIL